MARERGSLKWRAAATLLESLLRVDRRGLAFFSLRPPPPSADQGDYNED